MGASAGSFYSTFRIDFSQLDQDIAAGKQRHADFVALWAQPVPISAGAAGGVGGTSSRAPAADAQAAADQRAANGALSLAQAEARLAVAEGDTTRAISILNAGLEANAGASQRSILSVQTQVARLENGTSIFQQFGTAAKSSLLGLVGPAAAVGAAFAVLRGAVNETVEAFKFTAQLDQSRASIDVQLKGLRDSSEVFAEASAYADRYKLTQAETTEAIQASIPVIRNSKSSMEDILGVFDRLLIKQPGKTFQDAARALSELQAGQVVSIEHIFNVSANDANRMKKEIEGGADAIQVLNKYLTDSGIGMDALAAKTQGATGKMRDLAREQEKRRLALGADAQGPGLALLNADLIKEQTLTADLRGNWEALADANQAFAKTLLQTGDFEAALAERTRVLDAATEQQTAATMQAVDAKRQAAVASATQVSGMDLEIQAAVASGQAIRQQAEATAEAAAQSLIDTENKRAQTAQTELLNAQTMSAVDVFLQLHPNISAAGIASLQAAGQISPLISQLAQAAVQAREATAALAQFQMQQGLKAATANQTIGFLGNEAEVRNFKRSQTATDLAEERAAYQANAKAVADAKRDQVLAVGSNNAKIRQLESDLAEAERVYGEGSAQAIRAQTALEQEQESQRHARGRAAGAAKLSDQQKLNNQLLADEQKFNNQMADLDAEHYKKQLDIQKEFDRKSLEEQHRNEVAKRQSRADFYDNLTQASKTLGQKESQALSAEYEEAYAKAQQIAQAGNQKLAADYLAMRQRQIQEEAEYQKQLAEARKNKDKDEIARLQQIHQLRQEADAEEEKQLLEGGDANVKARDEATAAEQQRYEEAQDKIRTAADRTTQAKIDNADRSGKAIDAENTKLREQEQLYARIGARAGGGVPPSTAGAVPPSASSEASPAAAAASGGDQLWRVFDQAVVDAIGAQTTTLMGGLGEIRDAVGALLPRINAVETAVRGLGDRFAR